MSDTTLTKETSFVETEDPFTVEKFLVTKAEHQAWTERAEKARAGETTARRAAFIQSLVSSAGGQRPGILEHVLNRASQLVNQGGLTGLSPENHERLNGNSGGSDTSFGARQNKPPALI